MDEGDSRGPDGPDETTEIDLRDRLRFAAGALAADLGDQFPFDLAEALVFSSAQGTPKPTTRPASSSFARGTGRPPPTSSTAQ